MLELPDDQLVTSCQLTGDECAHMLECATAVRRHLAANGIPTGPAAGWHESVAPLGAS